MSSAVSAHPSGGLHPDPVPTSARDQQKARTLGLTSATSLVVGTVVGAGVFTMPAVLAGAGTVLITDEDIRTAEREQWDDGNNYLAVAPGVILGYDRNVATNTMLRKMVSRYSKCPAANSAVAAAALAA
jgi:hypothetical protein